MDVGEVFQLNVTSLMIICLSLHFTNHFHGGFLMRLWLTGLNLVYAHLSTNTILLNYIYLFSCDSSLSMLVSSVPFVPLCKVAGVSAGSQSVYDVMEPLAVVASRHPANGGNIRAGGRGRPWGGGGGEREREGGIVGQRQRLGKDIPKF